MRVFLSNNQDVYNIEWMSYFQETLLNSTCLATPLIRQTTKNNS